jgi:hypothetical protein
VLEHIRPISPGLTTASTHLLAAALWPVLCPTTVLPVGPPSAQSPFAQCECDPHWGDALSVSSENITSPLSLLRTHSPVAASSPLLRFCLVERVFAGCLPVPAARRTLPSRPGEFHPEALTDSGREPLDSSGSCHRMKAAAFRQDQSVPPVSG